MTYVARSEVVTSQVHDRILCHSVSLGVAQIQAFLGHDPRSRNWKALPPSVQKIYQDVQRPTAQQRIDGLKTYLGSAIAKNSDRIGTIIPISIGQMSPANIEDGYMVETIGSSQRIVLDGLARITAFMDLFDDDDFHNLLNREITIPVSLYAPPPGKELSQAELGQLFSDFNRYAIPVPQNKALQLDMFDPYVHVVRQLEKSSHVQVLGGLKWSGTISKTDAAFMTGAGFTKFIRIACEGQRAYQGKLSRQIKNPWLTDETRATAIANVGEFMQGLTLRTSEDKWRADKSIMLTTHFWHALGVICNELWMKPSPISKDVALSNLTSIDWTWNNPTLQTGIGRTSGDGVWSMNTGSGAFKWLVDYMRQTAGLQKAA